MTSSGTMIPVPLTDEKEQLQLRKTFQCSTIEKRAPNVPYVEGVGSSGLEQQRKVMEKAAQRKAMTEAARARGEGTSAQRGVLPRRGTLITTRTTTTKGKDN